MDYNLKIEQLQNNSKSSKIGFNFKVANKPLYIINGFINSRCEIKPYSNDVEGYYLDDNEIYVNFLKQLEGVDKNNIGQIIALVQRTIDEYYIGGVSAVETVRDKMRLQGKTMVSVKEYKGIIHRSTLGNNLLRLAGIDCKMILGNIGSENHAYLIVTVNNKNYIFDPSNHTKVFKNGELKYKIQTFVEKDADEIEGFLSGKNDLTITQKDVDLLQLKNPGFTFNVPQLTYSTRSSSENVVLEEQKTVKVKMPNSNIFFDYVSSLINRGLDQQEVVTLLGKLEKWRMKVLFQKLIFLNKYMICL